MSLSDSKLTDPRTMSLSLLTRSLQERNRYGRRKAILWPEFSDASRAADVVERVLWHAGGSLEDLFVGVAEPSATGQAQHETVKVIESEAALLRLARQKDMLILVWDASAIDARVLRHVGRLRILDPLFHDKCETLTASRLKRFDLESSTERAFRLSAIDERWMEFLDELGDANDAGVFGTGPGLAGCGHEVQDLHDVRLACNSIVMSDEMMDRINPNVVVFSDPLFHFGYSRQAAEFRDRLEYTLAARRFWVIAPFECGGWLDAVAACDQRVIQLPLRRFKRPTIPSTTEMWLPRTGNVLTGMMLPIAAALSSNVTVYGCDGRPPQSEGFWNYAPTVHDDDRYTEAVSANPSFFRDRNYERYYEEHCTRTERSIKLLTSEGVVVRLGSPSMIPALDRLPRSPSYPS